MNQLSWLIYAASFCDGLNCAAIALIVGAAIGIALSLIALASDHEDVDPYLEAVKDHARYPTLYPKAPNRDDYPNPTPKKPAIRNCIKRFIFLICACLAVTVVTPSKETVYAIAASEMGENLLKTPTAAKAVKALDAWLDKQIAK